MAYFAEALSIQLGADETERRFVWLQESDFSGAYVQLASAAAYLSDGGFTEENSRKVRGTVSPVTGRGVALVSCKVRVGGLVPGTEYCYRVGCDETPADRVYRFRLPAAPAEQQSFFLISDLHVNVYRRPLAKGDEDGRHAMAGYGRVLDRAVAYGGERPDFFLSLGDNISVCNMTAAFYPDPTEYSKPREADYAFLEHLEFLSPETLKEIPFASVLGNHDAVKLAEGAEPVGDGNNIFYDLPNDDGYAGHYEGISSGDFFFVSGELLVVGINAMVSPVGNCTACAPEVHRAFIERALKEAPPTRFRILLCHVPAYSYVAGAPIRLSDGKPTETAQMAAFFPSLCDPYGFDVVFTGHQHAFSRTYPLLDGRVVGEEARHVERMENGGVTETLTRPKGVIHYNLSAAMNHAFFSGLPAEPAALYPAYGVTEAALAGGREAGIPNADKFEGLTYRSGTFAHVTVRTEGEEAIMQIAAVRSDTGEAFDTLIIRK